ncbi:hypothetical protein [Hansschlegelia sp. KR7-227]|uniref:hypothetical protein n=1 Tax=Hansschlegelia sp. KR7-227 TaxID=3400914 RepID=UPI003BFEA48E
MTMQITWLYWSYAATTYALLLSCILSAPLFLYWSVEAKKPAGEPDLPLWYILPWTVATHAAIAMIPLSWIWPRVADPAFSVGLIQAVTEGQSFASYLVRTLLLLVVVWGKITILWRVRQWSPALLIILVAWIGLLSAALTMGHRDSIHGYCGERPDQCARRSAIGGAPFG